MVIGASGQLGTDLNKELNSRHNEVIGLDHSEINIEDLESVVRIINSVKPQIIINTAAYHNVEKCEEDPVKAFKINSLGAKNLAISSNENNCYLMHISTDYVFNGDKMSPYIESDLPRPLNVYGNTKVSGEYFIESLARRFVIIRTSGLYGTNPCRAKGGMNFVDLMIELSKKRNVIRVVDSEVLTPTSTVELSKQIAIITENQIHGVCHATSEGYCSWYDFAKEIFDLMKITISLEKASPGEFPAKVPRPSYSVLENKLLKDNGLNSFKVWQNALEEYLFMKYKQDA